ncbi:MAG TPA: hypothetical protein DIW46_07470 [Microbacterium sp.]|nr:hypothetical protein [Microbacterium sp.]
MPGGIAPQYPVYGGPSAYAPIAPGPGVGGLAIAALIVGIVAFVTGWIPIVGLVFAVVGIVLGILAVRKPRGKGFGITALILSGLAAITGIIMLIFLVAFVPNEINQSQGGGESYDQPFTDSDDDGSLTEDDSTSADSDFDEAMYSAVSGQLIETPCWSYDGPEYFTNNISADAVATCSGQLELWGEYDENDNFFPTGAGMTAGEISVMPLSIEASDAYGPVGDIDAAVEGLQEPFFSKQGGEPISEERITIDGVDASLIHYDSDSEDTQTKAFLTTFAPEPYQVADTEAQLFVIILVTPYSNGEEQLQQIIDTWEWK